MTLLIYSILYTLALPLIFGRLWLRGHKSALYRKRWAERLGHIQLPKELNPPFDLWIHAVSLGESVAASLLIDKLLSKYPNIKLYITCTTPTGSTYIINKYSKYHDNVFHSFLPFDLRYLLDIVVTKVKPRACVVMETEIWPNLFASCKANGVPIVLANARLSNKSMNKYKKITYIANNMLRDLDYCLAQSLEDKQNFIEIGMDASKIVIAGNVKFDIHVDDKLIQLGNVFKEKFQDRLVFSATSTHHPEEQQILIAFKAIISKFPNAILLLVPRHPDRFDKVEKLIKAHGFNYTRRSNIDNYNAKHQVILGDSMGELIAYYQASTVTFVGGSLAKIGGHNMLEPIKINVPTIVGPHLHNFSKISKLLFAQQAMLQINQTDQLSEIVCKLFANKALREQLAAKAKQIMYSNKGAVAKNLEIIEKFLANYKMPINSQHNVEVCHE